MSARKSVLLRFQPDLLERVDVVAGAQNRHEFLMQGIEWYLDEMEKPLPSAIQYTHPTHPGLFARTERLDNASQSEQGSSFRPVAAAESGSEKGSDTDGEGGHPCPVAEPIFCPKCGCSSPCENYGPGCP